MAEVLQQDSNQTGLRLAREVSPGALSGSDVWLGLEPNSYKNFGGQFKKVARSPINANRQNRKGVLTDLDASGSVQSDLTYQNFQTVLAESVFCANFRKKAELAVATVSATTGYNPASGGDGYIAGDLLWASGFAHAANNGLKIVTGTPGASSVEFSGMTAETGATGTISKVGHQYASADVSAATADQSINTAAGDFTKLGLMIGEWIFCGDDNTADTFADAGAFWGRVLTVDTAKITFDKIETSIAADDAGTGKTIRIYCGRVIRNELDVSSGGNGISKITYQMERTLGFSDDSEPSEIQAEYLPYSLFDQVDFTMNTADKVTFDLSTVSAGYEVRPSSDGVKPGTRPEIVSGAAFNTSVNIRRAALTKLDDLDPLFAFLSDFTITVKNNVSANKALSRLGAFSLSLGVFQCSTAGTAYFADVGALSSIKTNDDITVDAILTVNQQAIVFDLPLVAIAASNGLSIAANTPITLAVTSDAGTGADNDPNKDYTMAMMFFDYVPIIAQGIGD